MCSPVAMRAFTLLRNRHHHPSPEHVHPPELELCPHETLTPHSWLPQALQTTIPLSVSTNWAPLGTHVSGIMLLSPDEETEAQSSSHLKPLAQGHVSACF